MRTSCPSISRSSASVLAGVTRPTLATPRDIGQGLTPAPTGAPDGSDSQGSTPAPDGAPDGSGGQRVRGAASDNRALGRPRAEVVDDAGGELDQRHLERSGDRGDHLARGLL